MDRFSYDDAYAQVAQVLFGDGGYELIAKASKEEREELGRKIGLATNTAGAIAGPAALWQATKAAKAGKGGVPRDLARSATTSSKTKQPTRFGRTKVGRGVIRAVEHLDSGKGRSGKLLAAGAGASIVGLQAANWAGDAIAARTLSKPKDVHKSAPDMADLHAPGQDKPKKIYLNKGTLVLAAAEKSGPVALKGAKATGRGAKRAGQSAKPVVVETGRKIKEKVGKRQWNGSDSSFSLPSSSGSSGPTSDLDITWEGEFSKRDDEKRQVFGWASITEINGEPVVDLQGDYITTEEIEKAAYDYVHKSRKGGDMHRRNGDQPHHVSDMIESFVVTPEKREIMGLPDSVPTGWWVGFAIHDDDTWNLVKSEKRKGFSIHGKGKRNVPSQAGA